MTFTVSRGFNVSASALAELEKVSVQMIGPPAIRVAGELRLTAGVVRLNRSASAIVTGLVRVALLPLC